MGGVGGGGTGAVRVGCGWGTVGVPEGYRRGAEGVRVGCGWGTGGGKAGGYGWGLRVGLPVGYRWGAGEGLRLGSVGGCIPCVVQQRYESRTKGE